MAIPVKPIVVAVTVITVLSACGGSSAPGGGNSAPGAEDPVGGSISISLTDGPWEDAQEMVLHITGVEMGHANGDVVSLGLRGGAMSVDMMQLQNGVSELLVSGADVPTGQYDWMRLQVDLILSHIDLASTGGRHNMQMGPNASNGLEVHEPFQIQQATHSEFMLDFDLRRGVQQHSGGMMGDQYELHSAMRLVNMGEAGGLTGMVDASMIDINHPDCDIEPGGNWAYLYPGDAVYPDDIAESDDDGMPGPMAADRVEMDNVTGDHMYYFGYLTPGSYRVAMTCSGEWDEDGDDDYPSDPDGRFSFQMFSDPVDVAAGQMHDFDLMP
jgi:hypothetical protein